MKTDWNYVSEAAVISLVLALSWKVKRIRRPFVCGLWKGGSEGEVVSILTDSAVHVHISVHSSSSLKMDKKLLLRLAVLRQEKLWTTVLYNIK